MYIMALFANAVVSKESRLNMASVRDTSRIMIEPFSFLLCDTRDDGVSHSDDNCASLSKWSCALGCFDYVHMAHFQLGSFLIGLVSNWVHF